jgi:hypothetical protein
MQDAQKQSPTWFKILIGMFQILILAECIRWALSSLHPLAIYIGSSGFVVGSLAGWFPRQGKLRWALGGLGISLMLIGVSLSQTVHP